MSIKYPEIHALTSNNKEAMRNDVSAICAYCEAFPRTKHIKKWCDGGQTALCPKCGVDSLIPYVQFMQKTDASLQDLHKAWFGDDAA